MSDTRLYELLAENLSEHKRVLFQRMASQRTRHICMVMEDIYQPQNSSAILRSAESWGIQNIHIIENRHSFAQHRRITKGAGDWLTIYRYNKATDNTSQCLNQLKDKGYTIATTALDHNSILLDELDLTKPTAIVLGTELTGVSDTARDLADVKFKIPMFGFTESLNVAAAAAVISYQTIQRIRANKNINWQLDEASQLALKIEWAKKSIYWSKHITDLYEAGEIK